MRSTVVNGGFVRRYRKLMQQQNRDTSNLIHFYSSKVSLLATLHNQKYPLQFYWATDTIEIKMNDFVQVSDVNLRFTSRWLIEKYLTHSSFSLDCALYSYRSKSKKMVRFKNFGM